LTKELTKRSQKIDVKLHDSMREESKKVKLLLLGAVDSGKSTIFKQLQLMHGAPRSEEDLDMFATVVKINITALVMRLLPLVDSLDLEGKFEIHEWAAYNKLLKTTSRVSEDSPAEQMAAHAGIPVTLKQEIQTLFRSKTWESVWAQRSTVNAIDSHMLFIDDLDEIVAPGYVPSVQHIVNARIRTTNPIQENYDIGGQLFEIYDVGGQRSERRKWLPLFDNVTAVIFVAALSEYDQKLSEDPRMNRMTEAIGLFRTIVNHDAFRKVPFLLFLNKKDLFEEKLPISNIQDQEEFSDYAGDNYDEATEYFKQKFSNCYNAKVAKANRFFVHSTDATNTENGTFFQDQTYFCGNIQNSISYFSSIILVGFVWATCVNIIKVKILHATFM